MPKKKPLDLDIGNKLFPDDNEQDASKPVYHETNKEVSRQTSIPVIEKKNDSLKDLKKSTFYLSQKHIVMLENLRLRRINGGHKLSEVDKSSLVREAIELLYNQ